jgi:hypothetical protein
MPGFELDASNPTVDVIWETLSNIDFIQVNASYEFNAISPFIPDNMASFTLTATSRLPVP